MYHSVAWQGTAFYFLSRFWTADGFSEELLFHVIDTLEGFPFPAAIRKIN